jgi:hypothetical protein
MDPGTVLNNKSIIDRLLNPEATHIEELTGIKSLTGITHAPFSQNSATNASDPPGDSPPGHRSPTTDPRT